MPQLILTLIGQDRPGLVNAASQHVAAAGGNWLESRMARLAGQFAGIALVEVPDAQEASLEAALRGLESEGLHAAVQRAGIASPDTARRRLHLDLVGQDRPGIVRDITRLLAARRVNIEELATRIDSGSFSGERMFHAEARLKVPDDVPTASLREALERLGNELMVDITVDEAPAPG